MISRDVFIQLLEEVKRQDELDFQFSQDLGKHMMQDTYNPSYVTELCHQVLSALKKEMRDDYDNISYFVYETQWGEKADEYFITITGNKNPHYKKGEKVKFYTAGDVYDYLVNEMPLEGDLKEDKNGDK